MLIILMLFTNFNSNFYIRLEIIILSYIFKVFNFKIRFIFHKNLLILRNVTKYIILNFLLLLIVLIKKIIYKFNFYNVLIEIN